MHNLENNPAVKKLVAGDKGSGKLSIVFQNEIETFTGEEKTKKVEAQIEVEVGQIIDLNSQLLITFKQGVASLYIADNEIGGVLADVYGITLVKKLDNGFYARILNSHKNLGITNISFV